MPVRRHPVALPNNAVPLADIPLDARLIASLKETYELVRRDDLRLADIFYARLFAAAPGLRPLFRGDPQSQARKLTASLDAIVRNLEAPEENAAMLTNLGRRHTGYGAEPAHYDLVIGLLVESMREILGPAAEPSRLDEWRMALRLISDRMIQAGRADDAGTPHPGA